MPYKYLETRVILHFALINPYVCMYIYLCFSNSVYSRCWCLWFDCFAILTCWSASIVSDPMSLPNVKFCDVVFESIWFWFNTDNRVVVVVSKQLSVCVFVLCIANLLISGFCNSHTPGFIGFQWWVLFWCLQIYSVIF